MSTTIEWTDVTDNIIAVKGGGWWCRKISPGCANCYAAKLNQNTFYGGNKLAYSGPVPELILRHELMDSWKRQRLPRRHFVGSMTDIFGDWVSWEWIYLFLDAMLAAPRQTFQLLTKRPGLASNAIRSWLSDRRLQELPANIWIGTSVENQECANMRIPQLLGIPAAARFLSCEPLLGPIDFSQVPDFNRAKLNPRGFWVITGGESGTNARPMHPDWPRGLRDQCVRFGFPFLFKQWGSWVSELDCERDDPDGRADYHRLLKTKCRVVNLAGGFGFHGDRVHIMRPVNKKLAGRLLDGREWNEFPVAG